MDIQAMQRAALLSMLNLNVGPSADLGVSAGVTTWKVLVYDEVGRDILAPILSIGELRAEGITLNLPITSRRERVPGVPAIYFVSPTPANIERIAADTAAALYDAFYLNFTTMLPRVLLEDLAFKTIERNCASRISKIYDLNSQFISFERSLFTMNIPEAYSRLGSRDDDDIMSCIDKIVESVFSVICTLGVIPIIQARPGDAAEMVATKLDARLRECLRSRSAAFSDASGSFRRPILVLVDRNLDLATPLQHQWTYQPMTHDLLGLSSNRVSLEVKGPNGVPRKEDIYLDANDEFWTLNVEQTFPEVAARVDSLMKEHHAAMSGLKSAGEADIDLDSPAVTSKLASMINDLPELQKKKRQLDVHTNLATAIMRHVQERSLDTFFEVEDRMAASGLLPDQKSLLAKLGVDGKGTPDDKLRLLLQYYLASDELSNAQFAALKSAVEQSGASSSALTYLRQIRMMKKLAASGQHDENKGPSLLTDLAKSTAISSGLGWLKGNVKNLLPLKHKTPLTRVVRELMLRHLSQSLTANFKTFDPRAAASSAPPTHIPKAREAIVVVCGGGTYPELHNLIEWARDASASSPSEPPISIIYGCTDMVSPTSMLRQIEILAEPDAVDLT
uniref:Sec1-like protein n=1 Tax=Spongospora subterranea TaxID=70186 RepID=A0A0H5R7W9_9EUKA|eukprot:CRZ10228.1 hypothetical protein [Spongospora subterranea]